MRPRNFTEYKRVPAYKSDRKVDSGCSTKDKESLKGMQFLPMENENVAFTKKQQVFGSKESISGKRNRGITPSGILARATDVHRKKKIKQYY